jgi:hypothetical protein
MPVVQLPTIFVVVVGDSISAPDTPGGVPNNWYASARTDLASRFPGSNFVFSNKAVPGTTTAQHWSVQIPVSVGNTPAQHIKKFALWFAWSPNDGGLAANITTAYNTYQSQFIALCRSVGFIPLLGTNIPCDGIPTSTDDAARLSINASVRAAASTTPGSEIVVADFDTAMSDQASPARMFVGSTPDGTHPTTNPGEAAMWPPLSNALATYLASVGVT